MFQGTMEDHYNSYNSYGGFRVAWIFFVKMYVAPEDFSLMWKIILQLREDIFIQLQLTPI